MKSKSKAISTTGLDAGLHDGDISQGSHVIMVDNLNAMTTLGRPNVALNDASPEDRVTLVVPVIDCTGSRASQAAEMRLEFNNMIAAFKKSSVAATILVSPWLFRERNSELVQLNGFVHLDQVILLDTSNYDPDGFTGLYDALLVILANTFDYAKQLINDGYRVKVVMPIITDGEDNASAHGAASQVRQIVEELKRLEIFVVGIVAFGSGFAYNAADEMGIDRANVREFGMNDKDVRALFDLVSSSVIRQSQTQVGGSASFFN